MPKTTKKKMVNGKQRLVTKIRCGQEFKKKAKEYLCRKPDHGNWHRRMTSFCMAGSFFFGAPVTDIFHIAWDDSAALVCM